MKLESIFPNIAIALRIFCTIPVTVAEAERTFSKLKQIKSVQRSTMKQERLNGLATLAIEHDLAKLLNFDDVINNFALAKSRRVCF
uniref:HAT C-terminal dimerisation domain-containing protein n=1 Tax=Helobdella robusta TaxID=6412 RepID=T1FZZ5_HELRO